MNTCKCGNPLPEPVDEFGDPRAPVCIICWLNPDIDKSTKQSIQELEKEISEAEEEIDGLQDEVDELEDEIDGLKSENRKRQKQIAEITKNGAIPVKTLKQKLYDWIFGEPMHDKTDTTKIFKVQS